MSIDRDRRLALLRRQLRWAKKSRSGIRHRPTREVNEEHIRELEAKIKRERLRP